MVIRILTNKTFRFTLENRDSYSFIKILRNLLVQGQAEKTYAGDEDIKCY